MRYWPVDLQGPSGQLMRLDAQRGCGNFLRPHSKQMAPTCPSLVLAGAMEEVTGRPWLFSFSLGELE